MIFNELSGKSHRRLGSIVPMNLIGWIAERHSVLAPKSLGGRPANLLEKFGVYCWVAQELFFKRNPAFKNGRIVPHDSLKRTFS